MADKTLDEVWRALYGEAGYTGDIPEIKSLLHSQNKATVAIHAKLAELPCKTESLRLTIVEEMVEKHDDRIKSLERWKWKIIGFALALAMIGGLSSAMADNLLNYFGILGG
jgi:hypothetical protein